MPTHVSPDLKSFGDTQRTKPAAEALALGLGFAKLRGLRLNFETQGRVIATTRCNLTDRDGRQSVGLGKGVQVQSKSSALFEAFEHYFHEFEELDDLLEYNYLDLQNDDQALRGGNPDFERIISNRPVLLGRLAFDSLHLGKLPLRFPAFLIDPGYRARNALEKIAIERLKLMRYSTNSGTASGLSAKEAILHALLEVIERDSIGMELLRTVIRRESKPVRQVTIASLPSSLGEICDTVRTEVAGALSLWDITTDIGVPTTLAALSVDQGAGGRYFGSGASLSRAYSVERAVLEALQCFHAHHFVEMPRPESNKEDFTGQPLYARCFLERGHFGFRGGVREVSFSELTDPSDTLNGIGPQEQLSEVLEMLSRRNISAYARTIIEDDIVVVQLAAPQLERFYLVSHGIFVAPSVRGRGALS